MAATAARNVRLSKRGTRLLMYYENCITGFRPSCRYVEMRTNIPANKVSEIRKELVMRGMVGYEDNKIIFDWQRMRIYTGLAQPLPKRGVHKTVTIRQVISDRQTPYRLRNPYIGLSVDDVKAFNSFYGYTPIPDHRLTTAEKDTLKHLEGLSDEEYEDLIESFPENSFEAKPTLISTEGRKDRYDWSLVEYTEPIPLTAQEKEIFSNCDDLPF